MALQTAGVSWGDGAPEPLHGHAHIPSCSAPAAVCRSAETSAPATRSGRGPSAISTAGARPAIGAGDRSLPEGGREASLPRAPLHLRALAVLADRSAPTPAPRKPLTSSKPPCAGRVFAILLSSPAPVGGSGNAGRVASCGSDGGVARDSGPPRPPTPGGPPPGSASAPAALRRWLAALGRCLGVPRARKGCTRPHQRLLLGSRSPSPPTACGFAAATSGDGRTVPWTCASRPPERQR